jgi:hypothetical protein
LVDTGVSFFSLSIDVDFFLSEFDFCHYSSKIWARWRAPGSPERSWYATAPASTDKLNPNGAAMSCDARSGTQWRRACSLSYLVESTAG